MFSMLTGSKTEAGCLEMHIGSPGGELSGAPRDMGQFTPQHCTVEGDSGNTHATECKRSKVLFGYS